jgi:chromosome partitioning protein
MAHEIYDKLKIRYGELLCATRITETVALAESPMQGKDVFDYAPHSPGATDYRALTQELWNSGFFA